MSLPDLSHDWRPVFEDGKPTRYECSCLLSAPAPYRGLCPDRVLAWGDEREEEGREAALAEFKEQYDDGWTLLQLEFKDGDVSDLFVTAPTDPEQT